MSEAVLTSTEASSSSWYEPAALISSIAAVAVGALFCAALLARAGDRGGFLSQASGRALLALGLAWLAFTVGGIVCGVIALALPHGRRARTVIAVGLSAASLVLVPGTLVRAAFIAVGPHHPSDEALLDNFAEHEAQFEALARHVGAHRAVSDERLHALGLESLNRDSGDYFMLYVSTYGIVPSGSAKGYLYSTRPVRRTVDDLDEERVIDGYTYRHVKGPWYLFYEAW